MAEPRTIALLGLGTVGQGVIELLSEAGPGCALRVGAVSVRHPQKPEHTAFLRAKAGPHLRLPTEFTPIDRVPEMPGIDIVVEVTGAGEDVRDVLIRSLAAGKDVVTAGKALLSRYGREIFAAAEAPGAGRTAFEAAVCGGIPIIRTLRSYLRHDVIRGLHGIVNGTSNFILGQVGAGRSFADALAEAGRRGYAEPGGGADVSGEDAMNKMIILSRLAFGAALDPAVVGPACVRGIGGIDALDFRYARERLGRDIKAPAVAERVEPDKLSFRVLPALLPRQSVFADVLAGYNGIMVGCRNAGNQFLSGPGAGKRPTAHAVLADVLDLAALPRGLQLYPPQRPAGAAPELVPLARHEYDLCYVRFVVRNAPGIVGAIAEAFGRRGVHIHEVLQLEHGPDELRALGPLREGRARQTVDAGEAQAFAVTLNRCPFGHIESVVEQLVKTAKFHNLCPPVILPFEDKLPELSAGE
jgi:homoserine dehydrogenase